MLFPRGVARAQLTPSCRDTGSRPRRRPLWQWQLQGKIDTSVPAAVYDVDGFEVPKRTVQQLHRLGRKVVCYLDVGSWETYRSDAGQFPKSVIGRRYEGFPDERWLDIRRFRLFAKPLKRRFDLCARKEFDAVEPDNIAGWENRTGFPITRQDQLRFNRWVARQVHARGMAVALKNDGPQAKELVGDFDFAIVEQCFQYEECGPYRTFIRAREGSLRGRVRTRARAILPRGKSDRLQRDRQVIRPLRSALAPLLALGLLGAKGSAAYNPISLPRISFMTSSVPPPIGPRRASRTARSMPYSRM